MGVTSSNKIISTEQISCGGTLKVTLALSAAPDIISSPTDIVLALDRSGSMSGSPLFNMKEGAKAFIDIISESTGGSQDGEIGYGSRIGVVSFSDSATVNAQLITDVSDLKDAVDSLVAGGTTNHADAFAKSMALFDPLSSNARVIVMFTDGKTTSGLPPAPVAAMARASGIIIYCIGLIGSDGIDVNELNNWATDPDASHVVVTPDAAELEELFEELAKNITNTGATNIVINEIVNSDFVITQLDMPTKGSAGMINLNTIQWRIDELGVDANEGASLEFYIQHVALSSGFKQVNSSVTYSDNEGNVVLFPDPYVNVSCDITVTPDECPIPVSEISVEGCQDVLSVDAGDVYLEDTGMILKLDATLKNVCPGRKSAMAMLLSEVDTDGNEISRGVKMFSIPAHFSPSCRDVKIKGVRFVIPDDAYDSTRENPDCPTRRFRVRMISHYSDGGAVCDEDDE